MKNFLLASVGVLALGVAAASATDIPMRIPTKGPPVYASVPFPDWSGPYVGINGGYGWGNSNFSAPFTTSSVNNTGGSTPWCKSKNGSSHWSKSKGGSSHWFKSKGGSSYWSKSKSGSSHWSKSKGHTAHWSKGKGGTTSPVNTQGSTTGSFNPRGGVIGGTFGYNYQYRQVVFGVEGDIDWSGITGNANCGTTSCSLSNNWLGTLRARIGYAFGRFLPYATGGLAVGNIKTSFAGLGTSDIMKAGWAVGGGVEARISGPLTVKVEYLHVDLGRNDSVGGTSIHFSSNILRAGINYYF